MEVIWWLVFPGDKRVLCQALLWKFSGDFKSSLSDTFLSDTFLSVIELARAVLHRVGLNVSKWLISCIWKKTRMKQLNYREWFSGCLWNKFFSLKTVIYLSIFVFGTFILFIIKKINLSDSIDTVPVVQARFRFTFVDIRETSVSSETC